MAAAPLWVTRLEFDFLLMLLSRPDGPWIDALSAGLRRVAQALADSLAASRFRRALRPRGRLKRQALAVAIDCRRPRAAAIDASRRSGSASPSALTTSMSRMPMKLSTVFR